MPKIIFRPNPTPPPFVPPTPTPVIIYPVDIDVYSKIQFGEFYEQGESFNAVVNDVGVYWLDNYSFVEIYYTNDGNNFTKENITSAASEQDRVYIQITNIAVVSQAIGWYLKIIDAGVSSVFYMAVTLN